MDNIVRFISPYRSSNNYLIDIGENRYVGVDLGDIPTNLILDFLKSKNAQIVAYFLTHAHGDHCYGLNELYEVYRFNLYCSNECDIEMRNSKKNYSIYSDEIKTFEVKIPSEIVNHNQIIEIGDTSFRILKTPGHSPGCISIKTGNVIFSGDVLMKNFKTPVNFPNSDKNEYQRSIQTLEEVSDHDTLFYPGHGDEFILKDRSVVYL